MADVSKLPPHLQAMARRNLTRPIVSQQATIERRVPEGDPAITELQAYEPSLTDEENYLRSLEEMAAYEENERLRRQVVAQRDQSDDFDKFAAQYRQRIGGYKIPREQTLEGHREVVRGSDTYGFSRQNHPYFDEMVSRAYYNPNFGDPNQREYAKFAQLRENIAIIRNYAMDSLLDTPYPTPQQAKMMANMAVKIGTGLQYNDNLITWPWQHRLDMEKASGPNGAEEIYKYLKQTERMRWWMRPINILMGREDKNWSLPAIELSPFSPENVAKPPPVDAPIDLKTAAEQQVPGFGEHISNIGNEMNVTAYRLKGSRFSSLTPLDDETLDRSIGIAHDILDNLKIRLNGKHVKDGRTVNNQSVPGWVQSDPQTALDEAQAIMDAVYVYQDTLAKAVKTNPDLLQDPRIVEARTSVGELAYAVRTQGATKLAEEGFNTSTRLLATEQRRMPPEWKNDDGKSMDQMIERLQIGLMVATDEVKRGRVHGPLPAAVAASQQPPHLDENGNPRLDQFNNRLQAIENEKNPGALIAPVIAMQQSQTQVAPVPVVAADPAAQERINALLNNIDANLSQTEEEIKALREKVRASKQVVEKDLIELDEQTRALQNSMKGEKKRVVSEMLDMPVQPPKKGQDPKMKNVKAEQLSSVDIEKLRALGLDQNSSAMGSEGVSPNGDLTYAEAANGKGPGAKVLPLNTRG